MGKSGPKPRSIEERFWEKVNKDGPVPERRPDLGPCWLWRGAKLGKGYGVLGRGGRGEGYVYAHRFSHALHGGALAPGQQVHHECDNPSCVNPTHLREIGVAAHNRASSYAKLNEHAVAVVRSSAMSNADLARAFGVNPSAISRVRSGKSWA